MKKKIGVWTLVGLSLFGALVMGCAKESPQEKMVDSFNACATEVAREKYGPAAYGELQQGFGERLVLFCDPCVGSFFEKGYDLNTGHVFTFRHGENWKKETLLEASVTDRDAMERLQRCAAEARRLKASPN